MNGFWQLFISVILAFPLTFFTVTANSSSIFIPPTAASEFVKLGVDKMESGNFQEAIESFNEAIKLKENFATAYSDRCLAYLQLQDYHQAIADCNKAITIAPKSIEAYLNRGLAYYRQRDYLAAITNYNQALVLKPSNFRAHYNRAIALAATGNYSQAILDFNRALTQIPQTTNLLLADIYNDRGLSYFGLQNLATAMLDFNLAIRLNAEDYRAYFNRGCACGQNGDDFGAVRDFSTVIRLNPSNAQAYVNRGVSRYHLGYYQGAISDLQKASEYFGYQGKTVAYEKTLDLLKILRQQIQLASEIAFL